VVQKQGPSVATELRQVTLQDIFVGGLWLRVLWLHCTTAELLAWCLTQQHASMLGKESWRVWLALCHLTGGQHSTGPWFYICYSEAVYFLVLNTCICWQRKKNLSNNKHSYLLNQPFGITWSTLGKRGLPENTEGYDKHQWKSNTYEHLYKSIYTLHII
jgi:hypothetical protein